MSNNLGIGVNKNYNFQNLISWIFGITVLTIGILNTVLVHIVPGVVYLLMSLLYFPSVNAFVKQKTGISIPWILKIVLGIVIVMFTLGVSDLGDMID